MNAYVHNIFHRCACMRFFVLHYSFTNHYNYLPPLTSCVVTEIITLLSVIPSIAFGMLKAVLVTTSILGSRARAPMCVLFFVFVFSFLFSLAICWFLRYKTFKRLVNICTSWYYIVCIIYIISMLHAHKHIHLY